MGSFHIEFWRHSTLMTLRAIVAIAFAFSLAVRAIQAEPTLSQKEVFLDILKDTINKNEVRHLSSLIYTEAMTQDVIQEHEKSLKHLVEMLNANQDYLDYKWEEPPSGGKGAFEETFKGYHYFPNCEPVVVLKFLFFGSETKHRLILCVESQKLVILGTLRKPVP
jgi:hypothetical protein